MRLLTNLKNNFMEELVRDTPTLKMLNKAGKIKWPVLINWPETKKPYPRYVDEIDSIGSSFEHNGQKYVLRYQSGCFCPFLYRVS